MSAALCVECGGPIDPLEDGHAAHEPGCPVDLASEDWWCRCDAVAHVRCCRWCAQQRPVVEVPGQLDLLGGVA